jgi:hypothetical protein
MSKFIKLTGMILNTNDIHKIIINPNKYYICVASKKVEGFSWNFNGFGLGFISSYTAQIEVCETNHPTDYKIVSDWINQN